MQKNNFWTNPLSFVAAFAACFMMAFTSGCVSGGFKLTRQYASWVNSQDIVIRIILYILTSVVFVVTILIDVVINNTMDFWDGRVSQGIYKFYHDGKTFVAHHEYIPGTKLKRSTIQVFSDSNNKLLQTVMLKETPKGEIELYVDGHLRTRVNSIPNAPIASLFDEHGKKVADKMIPLDTAIAAN